VLDSLPCARSSDVNSSNNSLCTWLNNTAFHMFTAFGTWCRSLSWTEESAELRFQALEYLHPSTGGIVLTFEREQSSFRSWQNFVQCSFCKKSHACPNSCRPTFSKLRILWILILLKIISLNYFLAQAWFHWRLFTIVGKQTK